MHRLDRSDAYITPSLSSRAATLHDGCDESLAFWALKLLAVSFGSQKGGGVCALVGLRTTTAVDEFNSQEKVSCRAMK